MGFKNCYPSAAHALTTMSAKIMSTAKSFLTILILLASSACFADEFHNSEGLTDTGEREIVWQTLNAIDWMQTRTISVDPEWYETNPILGKHPSLSEVNAYFIASALFHATVSHHLDSKNAKLYQTATSWIAVGFVLNNHVKGIRLTVRY